MNQTEFRRGHDAFQSARLRKFNDELRVEVQRNFEAFQRDAADVPECDLIGDAPHLHSRDDGKVMPYAIAAGAALLVGTQFALVLTRHAQSTQLNAVLTPLLPIDELSQTSAEDAGLPFLLAIGVVATFVGVGKLIEASFMAVGRRTFFRNADDWFRKTLMIGLGVSAPCLLLSRVAHGTIAEVLAVIEPMAWVVLESTLLVSGALAWAAAVRFAWSRRFVRIHERLTDRLKDLDQLHPTSLSANDEDDANAA